MIIGIDASRAFVKNPAGPEYYSWHLIRNLAKIDSENEYVLYLRPSSKVNYRLPKNFRTKVISLKYLWTQVGLALETILNPIDILFIPAHTLPLLTRILRPRLPIIITIHGLEGKYLPQSGNPLAHIYRNWSIAWAVRFATGLIAVSEDTKKDIIKTYNTDTKMIKVVHEGVNYAHFARIKNEKLKIKKVKEKFKIEGDYILFVGTVQPRKNLIRLIKAFVLLQAKISKWKRKGRKFASISKKPLAVDSHALTLVIAGKLGWMYEDILRAPKKYEQSSTLYKIEDRVVFTGRVDDGDLPALYKGARAFVFPSLTEGFGLPVLEAQAAGTPVVAAKTGAIPEVAGDGAIFVNPKSVDEIFRGLLKILRNNRFKKELVKRGKENARKFSWNQTADNTLKFLRRFGENL